MGVERAEEMEPRVGIDVVVVSYKSPGELEGFLWSFFEHLPSIPWTLTVVNVSPDPEDVKVGEWAKEHGAIHMTFEENIGYGRACNAGAFATFGCERCQPFLAFFNADVRLTAGALDECCQALANHPDWGILGPRQVDDMGLITHAGIFGSHAQPLHRAWKQPNSPLYNDVKEAITVSGAAYFVRRKCWDELTWCPLFRDVCNADGAMLPSPMFFDETWVSYHAAAPEHRWRVIYLGTVTVVHKWHRSIIDNHMETWAGEQFQISQQMFRMACDHHSLAHD